MAIEETDYLKFLKVPEHYLQAPLTLKMYAYNDDEKNHYPVCHCGDILISFVHYTSFEDAAVSWERRKKRIDWNNLFVMMFTENREIAEQFTKLPYAKKVCFVPFETNETSLCYIDYRDKNEMSKLTFAEIVWGIGIGRYKYCNILDFLQTLKSEKRYR